MYTTLGEMVDDKETLSHITNNIFLQKAVRRQNRPTGATAAANAE